MEGGVTVMVRLEMMVVRSGRVEWETVIVERRVMINVTQIFLFILTDESSDESCSSALLLLVVQHRTHLSEGTQ